jgi:hypothetical protein
MASLKAQKATAPKLMRVDGNAAFEHDRIVLGASPGLGTPAAADTIDFRIPAGAKVNTLEFFLGDIDTGAAFVFGVGYRPVDTSSALAPNNTYFAAAGQTVGQAGGRLECAFAPIRFEEDVYIQLLVGTAPAGIAGNPAIDMIAGYSQDGPK